MATPLTESYLDAEAISKAESLGLNARYIVEGYMAGEHKSPYRGFAIEFAQHREYTPGDDVRHMDRKVLGRTRPAATADRRGHQQIKSPLARDDIFVADIDCRSRAVLHFHARSANMGCGPPVRRGGAREGDASSAPA
jgi:hypothetical protein